jgi:hypothetical protein
MPPDENPVAETGHPAAESTPTQPPAKPAVSDDAPAVFEGLGGKFKTPEELANYTKGLEEKYVKKSLETPAPAPALAAPLASDEVDPELAEIEGMLFTDPAKALKKHGEYIEKKLDARDAKKAAQSQFWTDFYAENPDLKSADNLVKLIIDGKRGELANLTISEAKKKAAELVRREIEPLAGSSGGTVTEVTKAPTTQFGGSKPTAPKAPQAPKAPINFCDQVRGMRGKKKQG